MDKEKFRSWFRIAMVPLFLLAFWQLGVPLEGLIVLGFVFLALVLLKGKLWRTADNAVERWLPFTKKWPDWTHKAVVVIVFILLLAVLKQAVYFALSLAGIDIQELIMRAVEHAQAEDAAP